MAKAHLKKKKLYYINNTKNTGHISHQPNKLFFKIR